MLQNVIRGIHVTGVAGGALWIASMRKCRFVGTSYDGIVLLVKMEKMLTSNCAVYRIKVGES